MDRCPERGDQAAIYESLPLCERLRARITELWNYPKVSLPIVENGRLFYQKNTGLQKQAAIYVRDGLTGPPALVLDPNSLSPGRQRRADGLRPVTGCADAGLHAG